MGSAIGDDEDPFRVHILLPHLQDMTATKGGLAVVVISKENR